MKYTAVVAAALLWCAGVAWCSPKHQDSGPFSEQAARFLDSIKMPKEQLAAVPGVLQDLERVLNTRWPGTRVMPFGSTVTGLALIDSDIDAYAILPDRTIKTHGSINFKAVHVLRSSLDYAKIHPSFYYVTCNYVPWNIKLDLLFNNPEGGRNSEILQYFFNLDERARNLAIIVKSWWSKTQKLAGSKMIPSYGMNCMVAFYLQQIGLLPPFALLQEHAKPVIYEGWNSGFDEIDYNPPNDESLYQLLGGFFEYYNDFDFDKYIVSTFLGRPVDRRLFESLENVPLEFESYRRIVLKKREEPLDLKDVMIVQDLFIHNKNLAVLIEAREDSPFTTECRRIARAYREGNEATFLDEVLSVQITKPQ